MFDRQTLEEPVEGASPSWVRSLLSTVCVNVVPIEIPPATIDIDLIDGEPALTLPEVSADPEEADDEESKVPVEEVFCGADLGANGRNGNVELRGLVTTCVMHPKDTYLSDQDNENEEEA